MTVVARSYSSFRKLLDESYEVVIAFLAQHRDTISRSGAWKVWMASSQLATLAERFQTCNGPKAVSVQRSLLQTWGHLQELSQLLEGGLFPVTLVFPKQCGQMSRERNTDWDHSDGPLSATSSYFCFFFTGVFRFLRAVPCSVVLCLPV